MSDRLVVDVPILTVEAVKIQQIAGSIGDESWTGGLDDGIGEADVASAAIEFAVAWELALDGLADAIDGLRGFMSSAVEAYEALDEKLSGQNGPRTVR